MSARPCRALDPGRGSITQLLDGGPRLAVQDGVPVPDAKGLEGDVVHGTRLTDKSDHVLAAIGSGAPAPQHGRDAGCLWLSQGGMMKRAANIS